MVWNPPKLMSFHFYFMFLCQARRCTQRRENQRLPPNPRHPDSRWVSAASHVGRASATYSHLSSSSRCRQSPRKCHSLIHSSWAFFIHPMPALTLWKLLLWTGMCTAKTCRDGCSPRGKWPGEGTWVGRCEQSRIIELCELLSTRAHSLAMTVCASPPTPHLSMC
jgi:hypothetical protein